jgi:hypothetical protein
MHLNTNSPRINHCDCFWRPKPSPFIRSAWRRTRSIWQDSRV